MRSLGVFDVLLDKDSSFFINIKCLETAVTPEFKDSYEHVREYYREIIMLLDGATKGDKAYRQAEKRFAFSEVNEINLGFSSGKHGAGFGEKLRKQIVEDAHYIIQKGAKSPDYFFLLPLFEEKVGPDRISDMVARIIYPEIIKYTKRICHTLGINSIKYPQYRFDDGIPTNPYKPKNKILLLPIELLHRIPIAVGWDDIDHARYESEALRVEMSRIIGEVWSKYKKSEKKKELRDLILNNPSILDTLVAEFKSKRQSRYDIFDNDDYIRDIASSCVSFSEPINESVIEISRAIVGAYKFFIENKKGSLIVCTGDSKTGEKRAQILFHAVAFIYCSLNELDLSPETDTGLGSVDFKISKGNEKVVIELKLTSNPNCVHGLESQIEAYAKAEETDDKIYILIDTGNNSSRVDDVKKKYDEMKKQGVNPAETIIIDAKKKQSASKR